MEVYSAVKVIKTAVIVIGAVAATIATAGALAPVTVGAALGTIGLTLSTVSAIAVAAGVVGQILNAIAPSKPKAMESTGSSTRWQADTQAGLPIMIGRTFNAGNIVKRETFGPERIWQGFATVYSLGPINAIEKFTANRQQFTFDASGNANGTYHDWMYFRSQLGTDPTATAMNGTVDGNTFTGWDANRKGSGLAASLWFLKFDKEDGKKYSSGVPSPGVVGQGMFCYDPRLDSTFPGGSGTHRADDPSTWAYSESPALWAGTWALGIWHNGKRRAGIGMDAANIDFVSIASWANVCDANGWKVGGMVSTLEDKWNVLKAICQAGACVPLPSAGYLSFDYQAPRVSLATITSDDLIGDAGIVPMNSVRERINTIVPRIRSEAHGWEVIPLDPVVVDDYVTFDGEPRTEEVDYQLVQQANQAAELANYQMAQAREIGPIDLPLKLRWLGIRPGMAVTLDMPELNLASQKAVCRTRAFNPQDAGVKLQLNSETDSKHAFALGSIGVAPPQPDLTPTSIDFSAPSILDWAVSAVSLSTTGAGSLPAIRFNGAVSRPDVDEVIFEYKRSVDSEWQVGRRGTPDTTVMDVSGIMPNTNYDTAVRYVVRGVLTDRREYGQVTTGNVNTAPVNIVDVVDAGDMAQLDDIYFGHPYFLEFLGGGVAAYGDYRTDQGIAAAISGQGSGATANTLTELDGDAGAKLVSIAPGAGVGENLVRDGEFIGSDVSHIQGADEINFQPTGGLSEYYVKFAVGGTSSVFFAPGGSTAAGDETGTIPVNEGDRLFYRILMRNNTNTANANMRVGPYLYAVNGYRGAFNGGYHQPGPNFEWHEGYVDVPSDATTPYTHIKLRLQRITSTQEVEVAKFIVSKVQQGADITDLNPKVYSIDIGARVSENLIKDPRFTDPLGPFVGPTDFTLDTSGNNYFWVATSSDTMNFVNVAGENSAENQVPVEPGKTYQFSTQVKTVGGSKRVRLRVRPRRSSGNAGAVEYPFDGGSTFDTSGNWQTISGNITIPDDDTFDYCEFGYDVVFTQGDATAVHFMFPRVSEIEAGATVGAILGGNMYLEDGVTLGTDVSLVTGQGISAGFTGQGALATINALAYGDAELTGFGGLAPREDIFFGSSFIRETDGGTNATLANFKTSQGVASAISGQGDLATSNLTDEEVNNLLTQSENLIINSEWEDNGVGWTINALHTITSGTTTGDPKRYLHANAGTNVSSLPQAGIPVSPGDKVYGRMIARGQNANNSGGQSEIRLVFQWRNVLNQEVGLTNDTSQFSAANTWEVIDLQDTAPAGAVALYVRYNLRAEGGWVDAGPLRLTKIDINADETANNISAGFTGQGGLATLNGLAYGDAELTGFGTLAPRGDVYFGSAFIKEASGGSNATLSNFKTSLGVASAIAGQAAAATDSTIEASADVTKVVSGPAELILDYDSGGTLTTNLPKQGNMTYAPAGGSAYTSGVTWAVSTVLATGQTTGDVWSGTVPSIVGSGGATLKINSGLKISEALLDVTATYNGKTSPPFRVKVKKVVAAPTQPSGGGSGSTFASDNLGGESINSTTWATISELTLSTASGVTSVDLTAQDISMTPDLTPTGTRNIEMKWQYESSPGTWTDIGAVANSDPDPFSYDIHGEQDTIDGTITCNRTKTGLSASTEYNFRLQARFTTGTNKGHYFWGNVSGDGS